MRLLEGRATRRHTLLRDPPLTAPEQTVRFRLTPQDTSFVDRFAEAADHLVQAAGLLAQMLGADLEGRRDLAGRLREVEHAGDDVTHAVLRRLGSTFVTPFDREDIYALASGLDDCLDEMEKAADLIVLYQLDRLPAGVTEQVGVLVRCAELTAEAMPRLRRMDDLAEFWIEVNRLENQADQVHRRMVADLFARTTDAIQLLKVKEVLETLGSAADAFETVASIVETIAVKES